VPDCSLVLFSVDRDDWFSSSNRVRVMRSNPDGTFHTGGLPPGDYWIAAVRRLSGAAAADLPQREDDLLKLTSNATRLHVNERQSVSATIHVDAR
jgi:hypothetical protein